MSLVAKPALEGDFGQSARFVLHHILCPLDTKRHKKAIGRLADDMTKQPREMGSAEAFALCDIFDGN